MRTSPSPRAGWTWLTDRATPFTAAGLRRRSARSGLRSLERMAPWDIGDAIRSIGSIGRQQYDLHLIDLDFGR
jgi:hypothetical protein